MVDCNSCFLNFLYFNGVNLVLTYIFMYINIPIPEFDKAGFRGNPMLAFAL